MFLIFTESVEKRYRSVESRYSVESVSVESVSVESRYRIRSVEQKIW